MPAKKGPEPGISDEAVKAKTGKTSAEWFAILDKAGARKMKHREIVALLEEGHAIGGWWDQMVTVAYERSRGLRDKYQKPSGYEVGASKTLSVDVDVLYQAWHSPKLLRTWLPDWAKMTVRRATPNKSMRITWPDGTSVNVYFSSKGDGRSQVAVQHGKLAGARDAARAKAYWAEALKRLNTAVAP
jgi:hypothetical protein